MKNYTPLNVPQTTARDPLQQTPIEPGQGQHFIPPDQDDDAYQNTPVKPATQQQNKRQSNITPPTRRSPRTHMRTTNQPTNIAMAAIYHFLGNAIAQQHNYTIPDNIQKLRTETKTESFHLQDVCNGVVHPVTGETITKYRQLANDTILKDTWQKEMCTELGRLSQGYKNAEGTGTVRFMTHDMIKHIPKDRTVAYARILVNYRQQKTDPNRVCITAGRNLIDYPDELTTRTADLTTTKIMWNSVLSTEDTQYMCIDIKNMYLATPMERFEYMCIPVKFIPEEFRKAYGLDKMIKNEYIYMQIERSMYGLPQAGILAKKLLRKHLAPHGYYELPHTPGVWKHATLPVQFTLAVDDFGVKYQGGSIHHLINALKENYEISEDWTGELYCGIGLKWNYKDRILDTSMPGYVGKQLTKYKHIRSIKPQHTPLQPAPRIYGKDAQKPAPLDKAPPLGDKEKRFIQQVVDSFLYYGRAVDPKILHALSNIASQQSELTETTLKNTHLFLDYMVWHPEATIRFYRSDMIINVHSDVSYLTAPKSRSRASGHYFLGAIPNNNQPIQLNGAIHSLCAILKFVASSAAEAELGTLFLNAREAKAMRLTLTKLGYPQPPTPIHIDNTKVVGIVNNTIKQQGSRSIKI